MLDLSKPHRRRNPLTGEWVIVSPQRATRPWSGRTDSGARPEMPTYDPDCYLCPGNERAGGQRNPDYTSTFVFGNDFAALLPHDVAPVAGPSTDDELFVIDDADGTCRVLCFSPRHDLTLANMSVEQVLTVVDLWCAQLAELGQRYRWVQIFETRGAIAGASNPHPHGQIWASSFLPNEALAEMRTQAAYFERHGTNMLVDYVEREIGIDKRIVIHDEHWVVVVPYWAYWPYETLLVPRRPVASLLELDWDERMSLAATLGTMLRAFDEVFDTPFPYCSGWHTAPTDGAEGWQLHAHYYPPLLRSADVAKIPASYELLANDQRDMTPEAAAAQLRELI
ncbi:MAG: UDP-glucose--hexose-1-phosphate uridylyltransferase [Actinomycetota bacterium]